MVAYLDISVTSYGPSILLICFHWTLLALSLIHFNLLLNSTGCSHSDWDTPTLFAMAQIFPPWVRWSMLSVRATGRGEPGLLAPQLHPDLYLTLDSGVSALIPWSFLSALQVLLCSCSLLVFLPQRHRDSTRGSFSPTRATACIHHTLWIFSGGTIV